MYQPATTFEEYVQIMAIELPHGFILDWWGRLELAIKEYFEVLGMPVKASMSHRERALGADPRMGPEIAAQIRELRLIRNVVAHEKRKSLSKDDVTQCAQKSYELIRILARAQSS